MSSTQNVNHTNNASPTGSATFALILIWLITVLITQAVIWGTARVLDHSNVLDNDLSWKESGLLSFMWIFLKIWHQALASPPAAKR